VGYPLPVEEHGLTREFQSPLPHGGSQSTADGLGPVTVHADAVEQVTGVSCFAQDRESLGQARKAAATSDRPSPSCPHQVVRRIAANRSVSHAKIDPSLAPGEPLAGLGHAAKRAQNIRANA
jgi:hypothetical protein